MTATDEYFPGDDRYLEHAIAEYLRRLDQGERIDRARFLGEHSRCAEGLQRYFEAMDLVEHMAGPLVVAESEGAPVAPNPPRAEERAERLPREVDAVGAPGGDFGQPFSSPPVHFFAQG